MDLILHMDDPCDCDSGVPQGKCCKKVHITLDKMLVLSELWIIQRLEFSVSKY